MMKTILDRMVDILSCYQPNQKHHTSKVLLFPRVIGVGNARSVVLAATVKIHGAVL